MSDVGAVGFDWFWHGPQLAFPLSNVCAIRVLLPNGLTKHCGTGTLIAPRVVLTAAHVVDVGQAREFRNAAWIARGDGFQLLQGLNRARVIASRNVASVILLGNGVAAGHPDDFALCVLDAAVDAESYRTPTVINDAASRMTRVPGYPQFSAFNATKAGRNLVEGHGLGKIDPAQPHRIIYELDTARGHSGAPVFFDVNSQRYNTFAGIHVADKFVAGGNYNMGLRFQPNHLEWINFFINAVNS